MTENNMLPSALLEEIHSLKENMERITGFILELKQGLCRVGRKD